MTRLQIAVEAMKVLLPQWNQPCFFYPADASEEEKKMHIETQSILSSKVEHFKVVSPNFRDMAKQCFEIADAMLAENERLLKEDQFVEEDVLTKKIHEAMFGETPAKPGSSAKLLQELREDFNNYRQKMRRPPEVIVMQGFAIDSFKEILYPMFKDTEHCFFKGIPVVAYPYRGGPVYNWKFYPEIKP